MTEITVHCRVNGDDTTLQGHPMARLLDVLRTAAHLTGIKEGCGEGECGACAVLMNGALVNTCLVPLLHAEGAAITTIEGIGASGLHKVQEAFIEHGGAQCGICTPGMILATLDLLARNPNPSEEEIRAGLAGNLCRCTGYMRIVAAVVAAMERSSSDGAETAGSRR